MSIKPTKPNSTTHAIYINWDAEKIAETIKNTGPSKLHPKQIQ